MPEPEKKPKPGPKLIEIHMLQNHVPANLNRDDMGAPKTCVFGGVPRARISSQCLKRSVRWSEEHFRSSFKQIDDIFEADRRLNLGFRTRELHTIVERLLPESMIPNDEVKDAKSKKGESNPTEHDLIVKRFKDIAHAQGDSETADNGQSKKNQPLYLGDREAERFVERLGELRAGRLADSVEKFLRKHFAANEVDKFRGEVEAKKAYTQFLIEGLKPKESPLNMTLKSAYLLEPCADVSLYGRMVTSPAFENVDAAMSVAHAISTHEVVPQTDYWTVVGDVRREEQGEGADHVAEALFNSATFYKYASLDWLQLLENLDRNRKLASDTLKCFLRAFALETPSGKRNSHAHNNLPSAILVEIRDKKVPTNYANAFAKPVTKDENNNSADIVFNSAERLRFYVEQIETAYAGRPLSRFWYWVPNTEDQKIEFPGTSDYTSVEIKDEEDKKVESPTKLDQLVAAVLEAVGGEE